MERKLPEPPPPVDAAVIARCVRRVEASRMAAHLKKPALWALQHPNQTNHAARSAHMHGRPGNPQLWSGTSLSMQAQWHKHKGTGFKSMCQKALVAAVACGAMVRWEASGVGFLYMPDPNVPEPAVAAVAAAAQPAPVAPAAAVAAEHDEPLPLPSSPAALFVPPPAALPPATPTSLALAQLAQPALKRKRHEDASGSADDLQLWLKTASAMMATRRTPRSK